VFIFFSPIKRELQKKKKKKKKKKNENKSLGSWKTRLNVFLDACGNALCDKYYAKKSSPEYQTLVVFFSCFILYV